MNPWIEATAWTLVHFVWQGTLIALATATGLRLCRRATPQVRYLIACAGLAAMLGAVTATAMTGGSSPAMPFADRNGTVDLAAPVSVAPAPFLGAGASLDKGSTPQAITPARLLAAIVWTWLAGVSLLIARIAGGCWRIHRLRTTALATGPSPWQAPADRLAQRLGVTVPFRIVDSLLVDAPIVAGWLRPLIVMPVAALANMTTAQIEALIAHELAHIQRHDYAINLIQTAAEALLFFHPGVWWVSRRIRQEREHCCDDVAVGVVEEATAYVEALAMLAAWPTRAIGPTLGAADGALLLRARRLLGMPGDDQRAGAGGLVLLGAAASLAVVMLLVAPSPSAQAQPQGQTAGDRRLRVTDHFEISYAPSLDLHAARIAEDAERAYERVSGDLRHHLASKVPLILFSSTAELQARVQAGTAVGAGAATDHVLFAVDRPADQWPGLITHELTHVFGFDILPGTATPPWISEGLAEYERGMWDPADLVVLRAAVRANTVPRLTARPADLTGGPRFAEVFGHAVFDFIESRWGKAGIRQLLFAVRQSPGQDPFQAALRLTTAEFDQAFQSYLATRLADHGGAIPESRFDVASSLELAGVVTRISIPANPQLACLELAVPDVRDDGEHWSIECGDARVEDVIAAVRLGQRVVLTGFRSSTPNLRRLQIRSLLRPADGFTWTSSR